MVDSRDKFRSYEEACSLLNSVHDAEASISWNIVSRMVAGNPRKLEVSKICLKVAVLKWTMEQNQKVY